MSSESKLLTIDDFVLKKQVGQGAFGKVYKAIRNDRVYAVKIIPKELVLEKKITAQLQEEITINLLLDHPNIVKCESAFSDEKNFYMVFEYSTFGSLEKDLGEKDSQKIVRNVLSALEYCHSLRICHRDIKLANILLFDDPKNRGEIIYKLTDWGLSKQCVQIDEKNPQVCGTPIYLPPEMIRKEKLRCDKSDIWEVGILAYMCVFDKPPFYQKGDTKTLLKRIVSEEVFYPDTASKEAIEFIKKLLQKDPDKRPTAKEALQKPWLNEDV